MAFQVGSSHYLYLGYSDTTTPVAIDTLLDTSGTETPAGTSAKDFTLNTDLFAADLIKDVTVGGNNNTVDVTTRQTARQGFSASIFSTTDATMNVQFAYEPRDDSGAYTRDDIAILQYCFIKKLPIFAVDLDKPLLAVAGAGGAQGIAANWSIGISMSKGVQEQVVLDVEFSLESYAQIIYTTDGTTANFRAIAI